MSTTTTKAGVIGWPVSHSLSPRLHGFWLDRYGIDGTYEAIAVDPAALGDELGRLAGLGYAGLNVTVPHKQAALKRMTTLSDTARRIGAVNTITFDKDKSALHGDNTDGYGFLENLLAAGRGFDATRGPAVVLGAGGAARAVVAALCDAGAAEVRLVNRTRGTAEKLAADLGGPISVIDWNDRSPALADAALLVNATTLGMTGKPPLDISLDALPTDATVNDIVYAPLETPLLVAAQRRGNGAVDGLGMLLHQARPAFKAFFGRDPEVSAALRHHVLAGQP